MIEKECEQEAVKLKHMNIDEAKSSIINSRSQISLLDDKIDELNKSIKRFLKENLEIEKTIESEEKFAEEKRPLFGKSKL